MKMIAGACLRASRNRRRMRAAPRPANISTNDGRRLREEVGAGLVRDGLGQQRLAGARRAVQQDALRHLGAERAEALGVAQELDDLAQLVLGLVDAGDVVPADSRLGVGLDLLPAWSAASASACRHSRKTIATMKRIAKTGFQLSEEVLDLGRPRLLRRHDHGRDHAVTHRFGDLVELDRERAARVVGDGADGSSDVGSVLDAGGGHVHSIGSSATGYNPRVLLLTPAAPGRHGGRSRSRRPRSRTSMRSSAQCTAARSRRASGGAGGRSRRRRSSGKAARKVRESVKPGSIDRHDRASGSCARDPAADRVHQRRLERRAVADHLLGELELVAVSPGRRAPRSMRARRLVLAQAGRHAAVDRRARRAAGITLIFSRRGPCVGASVTPSIGSTHRDSRGRSRMRSSAAGSPSSVHAEPVEQRARRLGEVEARLALGRARCQQRRELEQRVVADPRHRGVAGDAVGRDA